MLYGPLKIESLDEEHAHLYLNERKKNIATQKCMCIGQLRRVQQMRLLSMKAILVQRQLFVTLKNNMEEIKFMHFFSQPEYFMQTKYK